jgi:O-antigen ligase
MTFLIILAVIVVAVVAWRMRVPLLARILGQSESRIDRQLNRRKD